MSGEGVDGYDVHYPGDDVVDVLATDVYRNGFALDDYEQLLAVAGDKSIALGEVGMPPTLKSFAHNPAGPGLCSGAVHLADGKSNKPFKCCMRAMRRSHWKNCPG